MRRLLRALLAVTGVVSLLVLPSIAPAQAAPRLGVLGTGLECTVFPSATIPPVYGNYCYSSTPAASSVVAFEVQAPTPGHTYEWSLSGDLLPSSCTATTSKCFVPVNTAQVERHLYATVRIIAGTQTIAVYSAHGWAVHA
ncbi:hypothetical protein [Actinosynnema sp. NPDC023587]|uniref:hypothetical protein n=1 Tax=Actinosynnema sp. NPDC023587 TaxID=3154695 RepID=UPI0033F966F4